MGRRAGTDREVSRVGKNRKQTRKWWNEFWNRSYIYLDDAGQLANPHGLDADDLSLVDPADSLAVAVRNYTLFVICWDAMHTVSGLPSLTEGCLLLTLYG